PVHGSWQMSGSAVKTGTVRVVAITKESPAAQAEQQVPLHALTDQLYVPAVGSGVGSRVVVFAARPVLVAVPVRAPFRSSTSYVVSPVTSVQSIDPSQGD